jgi:hypothetical protein
MSSLCALTIGKRLIAENNARILDLEGDDDEDVSELDQITGISHILRSAGFSVTRQQCALKGRDDEGLEINYEMMALLIDGTLLGLNEQTDWNEIESTTRQDMPFLLSLRLVGKGEVISLDSCEDEKAISAITNHFPQWHRWMDEKISQLRQMELDANTAPARRHRSTARL